jgi:site-specific DNA-adenine methylase
MRPFFPYVGSKWTSAPHYGVPIHAVVVEPFAGSASYSVRHDAKRAVLVERFYKVAELWRYLIAATPDDIRNLPIDFDSVADLDVPDGAKYLIGFWISKGDAEPRLTRGVWARQYRHSAHATVWNEASRDRVASQVDAIKDWQVIEGDFTGAPDIEATWFIDPPYQVRGRTCYGHWKVDYADLATWCRSRRGQVIACEGQGADWLPFRFLRNARATNGCHRAGNLNEFVWSPQQ